MNTKIKNDLIDDDCVSLKKDPKTGCFHAKAEFLTPPVISAILHVLYLPCLAVAAGWGIALLFHWACLTWTDFRPFNALSVSPTTLLVDMMGMFAFLCLEFFGGYRFATFFSGKRLRVKIDSSFVYVGSFFKKRFSRNHRIRFACEPLAAPPQSPLYANSCRLTLVIDDCRVVYLTEVYNIERAQSISQSLTACLSLTTPAPGENNVSAHRAVQPSGIFTGNPPQIFTTGKARLKFLLQRLADLL